MKGTFQIVGWKGLFYQGREGWGGREGGREGDEKAYLKRACDDYAHYQRRPVIRGSWRPPPGRAVQRPRLGAGRKERSVICSLFPRIRLCTLPLFHYFFMSFKWASFEKIAMCLCWGPWYFIYFLKFLLEYSCFTRLCYFLLYSNTYTYIHSFLDLLPI